MGQGSDGFIELIVGAVGVEAVKKITEARMETDHWIAQMKAAGADQATIVDAIAAAWNNAGKNMNSTASEGLKQIISARSSRRD